MQVLDYDRFSRDDPIGEICLPLNDLDLTTGQTMWRALQPCKGHMVGIRGRYSHARGRGRYSHARDTCWVLEGVTATHGVEGITIMQGTHVGYYRCYSHASKLLYNIT